MGIRFEHQPSPLAVGMAAYTAGQGQARKRKEKYAMDLFRDERRIQARRDEIDLKYGGALGGGMRRLGGVGQRRIGGRAGDDVMSGGTVDPMDSAKTRKDRFRIERQRIANKKAARQGKPIPFPDAEIKTTPIETRDDRDRRRKREDADRARGFDEDAADLDFRREAAEDRIPDVPEHLVGTPPGQELKKLNDAEWKLRTGRDHDFNSPEVQESLAEIRARREDILSKAPKAPSPIDEVNKNSVVRDETTGLWRAPQPGEKATHYLGKEGEPPQPIDIETPEEKKKAAETAEAETPMGKMEGISKIHGMRGEFMKANESDYLHTGVDGGFNPDVHKELKKKSEELFPIPVDPTEMPNDPTTMPSRGSLETSAPPLPPDAPPGSKWIDENTIQYPDGRIFRKGGS